MAADVKPEKLFLVRKLFVLRPRPDRLPPGGRGSMHFFIEKRNLSGCTITLPFQSNPSESAPASTTTYATVEQALHVLVEHQVNKPSSKTLLDGAVSDVAAYLQAQNLTVPNLGGAISGTQAFFGTDINGDGGTGTTPRGDVLPGANAGQLPGGVRQGLCGSASVAGKVASTASTRSVTAETRK